MSEREGLVTNILDLFGKGKFFMIDRFLAWLYGYGVSKEPVLIAYLASGQKKIPYQGIFWGILGLTYRGMQTWGVKWFQPP